MLSGYGFLYIYRFHGSNTFERAHHAELARSLGLETATLRERKGAIEAWLSECEIEPPVSVSDHMGNEVFHWTERKVVEIADCAVLNRTVVALN